MKNKGGVQNEPTLREQLRIKLEENGLQWKYDFTNMLLDDLLDLIREHDKRVVGEDDSFVTYVHYDIARDVRNKLREEQRKRSEEELK